MNDTTILIHGAKCAELLPAGEWIFCWFAPHGDMIIAFAERNEGRILCGYWNERDGAWLEPAR